MKDYVCFHADSLQNIVLHCLIYRIQVSFYANLINFIMQSSSLPQRLVHCQGQLHLLITRTSVICSINTKQSS